jgi:hypothetical protein
LWFNSKETTTEEEWDRLSERGSYEIQICAGKMNGEERNGERKNHSEGNNIRGIGRCTKERVTEKDRNIGSEETKQHTVNGRKG